MEKEIIVKLVPIEWRVYVNGKYSYQLLKCLPKVSGGAEWAVYKDGRFQYFKTKKEALEAIQSKERKK